MNKTSIPSVEEQIRQISGTMNAAAKTFENKQPKFTKVPDGTYDGYIVSLEPGTVTSQTANFGRLKLKWTFAVEQIVNCVDKNVSALDLKGAQDHLHRVIFPSDLEQPKDNTVESQKKWQESIERYNVQTLELLNHSGLDVVNRDFAEIWQTAPKARGHRIRWTVKTINNQRNIYLERSLGEETEEIPSLPFNIGRPDGNDAPIGS